MMKRLRVLGIFLVMLLLGACSPEVELTTEDESALAPPPHCGCEDGNDDACYEIRTSQWACSYGPPCNYVAYRSDCGAGNACPRTTWNGCILQSQLCQRTGLKCGGTCSNGDPCSIQYPPVPPGPEDDRSEIDSSGVEEPRGLGAD